MTNERKQLLSDLAATLTTLAESTSGIHPASAFYLAFNMDMARFHLVKTITQQSGQIEWEKDTAKITDEGRETAAMIFEAMENAPGKSANDYAEARRREDSAEYPYEN